MHISLSRPLAGIGVSIDLHDFDPAGGYHLFLRRLCKALEAKFMGWHQGPFIGIGRILYKGYSMRVFWTEFPLALSFDCRNAAMADEMHTRLVAYFDANPEATANRVKPRRARTVNQRLVT